MITETDDVAAALDAAAQRWPEVESRRELLVRLVAVGRKAIEDEHTAETQRRIAAIHQVSGTLSGVYEPGYLERLREDWPG